MNDDDVINNPRDRGHLPVSGEFDANNPHADDSKLLNTDAADADDDIAADNK